MNEQVYKEMILDLYRHPLNSGVLEDYDIKARGYNPTCGDDMVLYVKFDQSKRVKDITHSGHGCAISQAAVSLLTESVKGKTKNEVRALTRDNMLAMLGIPISHTRMKCALLGLSTLRHNILQNSL